MELFTLEFLLFLASVVFISLSGVMMPGPVFAVTVAKGHKDRKAGVGISLGHGFIEIPLIFLIYLGFAQFFTSEIVKGLIGLGGGAMLIFLGWQMFKARKDTEARGKFLPYSPFHSGLITTLANPYFFLWWATIGAALILKASGFGFLAIVIFALTHWSCDLIWCSVVSMTTFKSKHLWSKRVHEIVFGGCALILLIFGSWFISSSLSIV